APRRRQEPELSAPPAVRPSRLGRDASETAAAPRMTARHASAAFPSTPASQTIRILGIETSCDETAIGIVENGRTVLANAVASSLKLHAPYGGVIPEIAARVHVETLWDVTSQALSAAKLTPEDIDAIAVT